MRVLQLIQKTQLRGAEIFACQLSSELINAGHYVDIVFLFPHNSELIDQFPNLNFISLGGKRNRRFVDLAAFRLLKKMIADNKYDLVQANAGDTLKYAALSRLIFRWKVPLIFRNATKMSGFIRNRFHRVLNGIFLAQCSKYISVSENCRRDIIGLFPEITANTVTIPIGTYRFDSVLPFKKDLSDNEPVFINIGSFAWEKNQTFLLDIFHHYFRRYNKGYLWILGEGRLRQDIESKISDLGLEKRVRLWGSRKDVLSILKSADVFIMPSVIEGLPGVILEALSCKIPVVVSDAGGIPEIIRHNVNGFCLSGFKIDEYVDCMEKLILEAELRIRFTSAGIKTLEEGYLIPVIAKRFLDYYTVVLSESARKEIFSVAEKEVI